jgi:hypothetical protein
MEKFMNRRERRRTALHEAAHSVVAVLLGVGCAGAAIRHDASGWSRSGPGSITDKLAICWAGIIAEQIKYGSADTDEVGGDLHMIEDYARRYGIDNVEAVCPKVRRLLRKNWSKVEMVAWRLASDRRLSGDEIDFLVRIA